MPVCGMKSAAGSSALIRASIACPVNVTSSWRSGRRSPLAEPDHELDEVEPGDRFGDRVLDLEPGVHLQEEVVAGGVVDDELDGAGRVVAHRARELDRRGVQAGAGGVGQVRCGRLLEQLLVPALHRALAGAQVDHVAVPVADDLHLDVARALDVPLDDHGAVAERTLGLGRRLGERVGEPAGVVHDADALPAAAGSCLHEDREPDPCGGSGEVGRVLRLVESGDDGTPAPTAMRRASIFEPIRSTASACGPIQAQPASTTARANSAFSDRKP